MTDSAERRSFVHRETVRLGRFLNTPNVFAWGRMYRCACGYKTPAPGEIWDHAHTHIGQLAMFAQEAVNAL